jgi:hypothetical protein
VLSIGEIQFRSARRDAGRSAGHEGSIWYFPHGELTDNCTVGHWCCLCCGDELVLVAPYISSRRPKSTSAMGGNVMSASGTVENAVEAMKKGAVDFPPKPFSLDHFTVVVEKALEVRNSATKIENCPKR